MAERHSAAYLEVRDRVLKRAARGKWGKVAALIAATLIGGAVMSAGASPATMPPAETYAAAVAPVEAYAAPVAAYTGPTSYQELEPPKAPDTRGYLEVAPGSIAGMVPYTYVPATGVRTEQSEKPLSVRQAFAQLGKNTHEQCKLVVEMAARLMDLWGDDEAVSAEDVNDFEIRVYKGSDGSIGYGVRPSGTLKPISDDHEFESSKWNRAVDSLREKVAYLDGEEAEHIRGELQKLKFGISLSKMWYGTKYEYNTRAHQKIVQNLRQYVAAHDTL
jgi:hypothetical protein